MFVVSDKGNGATPLGPCENLFGIGPVDPPADCVMKWTERVFKLAYE